MQRETRREILTAAGTALAALAGCRGREPEQDPASPTTADRHTAEPTGTATDTTSTTSTPSVGVHDDPYPVQLQVVATTAEQSSVPLSSVPTVARADVSERERDLIRAVLRRGETDIWAGSSDEVPPERLRDLIAVVDRLPPSRADRDPATAWRVARQATAYVRQEGQIYRLEMVKVAP